MAASSRTHFSTINFATLDAPLLSLNLNKTTKSRTADSSQFPLTMPFVKIALIRSKIAKTWTIVPIDTF